MGTIVFSDLKVMKMSVNKSELVEIKFSVGMRVLYIGNMSWSTGTLGVYERNAAGKIVTPVGDVVLFDEEGNAESLDRAAHMLQALHVCGVGISHIYCGYDEGYETDRIWEEVECKYEVVTG